MHNGYSLIKDIVPPLNNHTPRSPAAHAPVRPSAARVSEWREHYKRKCGSSSRRDADASWVKSFRVRYPLARIHPIVRNYVDAQPIRVSTRGNAVSCAATETPTASAGTSPTAADARRRWSTDAPPASARRNSAAADAGPAPTATAATHAAASYALTCTGKR